MELSNSIVKIRQCTVRLGYLNWVRSCTRVINVKCIKNITCFISLKKNIFTVRKIYILVRYMVLKFLFCLKLKNCVALHLSTGCRYIADGTIRLKRFLNGRSKNVATIVNRHSLSIACLVSLYFLRTVRSLRSYEAISITQVYDFIIVPHTKTIVFWTSNILYFYYFIQYFDVSTSTLTNR